MPGLPLWSSELSPKPPRQRHPCSGASITDSAVGDLNPDTRHPVLDLDREVLNRPILGLTVDWRDYASPDWTGRVFQRHRAIVVVASKVQCSIPGIQMTSSNTCLRIRRVGGGMLTAECEATPEKAGFKAF
ncbi:hypothetical protein PspLS_08586 [Pyricularia sp. CBS 133598]|nr:hypothetical protein PspLS_08586 [Pyricularia sp. CBS 133598]